MQNLEKWNSTSRPYNVTVVKEDHCYSIPYEEDYDVHQCNLCELKFKETDDLQTHLKTKHVLQLKEIFKNYFHAETRNDLK